ncbi:IS3 family transposase [Flavonifractor plautii]|uniref:IS3 family transposase n=1 Tax=Flavonifractor plautii TaxID=292800 RepID=UPI0019584510|nr:transposase [Flavonifractor plautii]
MRQNFGAGILFSLLKGEELYRKKYRSEVEFRAALNSYIVFYNKRRPHTKNGDKMPMKLESIYYGKKTTPEIES